MAPKTKEISFAKREQVVQLHKGGKTFRQISKELKISLCAIHNILKKKKETGVVDNKPRSGRPRKLTMRERRRVVKNALKNPKVSATMLAANIESVSGKVVTPQTVRNVLHDAGIKGRRPRKKPYISEVNRKKRLEFAKNYKGKTLDFWKNVIFSDESKFEIFKPKHVLTIWRKKNAAMEPQNILKTVKHGGGNVMVWGCMSYNGVGNLQIIDEKMTASTYIDVLRHNMKDSAKKLGVENTFIFQQDQDPKHTAIKTKEWLLYNAPRRLVTPPQSPDLNPIEHIWHLLDEKIRKCSITSKSSLKQALESEWATISPNVTKNLVESMTRRLDAVIAAKGLHTKY